MQAGAEATPATDAPPEGELGGRTVVLDSGSGSLRAGFSGQGPPPVIIPSIVGRLAPVQGLGAGGRPVDSGRTPSDHTRLQEAVFVGDEALARPRGELKLRYPVEWGLFTGWDDLEVLWKYVFQDKLGCEMEVCPLVVAEGGYRVPKVSREKVTELAFETFKVPSFCLAPSASLILRAAGRSTGLVVDVGEDIIRTIPVCGGYYLPHAVFRFDFGSRYFTSYLSKLVADKGVSLTPFGTNEVRDMKEKLAYVAQDYTQEKETFSVSQEKQYELPNGDVITLGRERFQCVEPIFQPLLLGLEVTGLAQHVVNTVRRCDVDIRQTLLSNVVLAGGGSLLPGLASRLQHDVHKELESERDMRELHVQVVAPPDRDLLAWKGGSLLASSPGFSDMCISLDEYDEHGPSLVHRKCF